MAKQRRRDTISKLVRIFPTSAAAQRRRPRGGFEELSERSEDRQTSSDSTSMVNSSSKNHSQRDISPMYNHHIRFSESKFPSLPDQYQRESSGARLPRPSPYLSYMRKWRARRVAVAVYEPAEDEDKEPGKRRGYLPSPPGPSGAQFDQAG